MTEEINLQDEKVKRESTNRFPCPSCGGNMAFDPESQTLSCAYCENRIEIRGDERDIVEYDIEAGITQEAENWGNEKRVIQCESCGAQTVLDATAAAEFCAFCGSSHIVKQEETAGIRPESLIPFKVSSEKAMGFFSKWIKKRFFAPSALKTQHQAQRMSGVYIPCWTYDSETNSAYTAQGGTYYYETMTEWVTENGQRKMVTKQVRKIRWWPTSGTYSEYFDDILINASGKVDEKLMTKLEPFHLDALEHYKPEYLSGFLAERYSIGLKDGWEKSREFIDRQINKGVIQQINADEVRFLNINTMYNSIKYKHILLPIWISAYTYKNKVYRYMVNGQTGEVQGTAPVSPWKVVAVVLASLAVIGIGVMTYLMLKQNNPAMDNYPY